MKIVPPSECVSSHLAASLTLAGSLLLFLCLSVGPAWGVSIFVDANGGGDTASITDAVLSASDGDTILIAAGTYGGSVSTARNLVLIGVEPGVVWTGTPNWYSLTFYEAPGGEVHGIRFTGGGTGIVFTRCGSTVRVTDCTFDTKESAAAGLGLYSAENGLELEGCHFEDCHSIGPAWTGGGAYIYSNTAACTITNCTFVNCTADGEAGGMAVVGTGSHRIDTCAFTNCGADIGAGLALRTTNTTVVSCTFETNHAVTAGGGLASSYYSGNVILGNVFRGNSCDADGGAVYCSGYAAGGSVLENLFVDNSAASGGAVFENGASDDIQLNTFYRNRASIGGAAIFLAGGTMVIHRNIVCAQELSPAITCQTSTTFLCNDFWDNFAGDVDGCPPPLGPDGNIFVDPLFCDGPNGWFELTEGSPCAPGHLPAGCFERIGSRPTGCIETPILPLSWGRLRSLFR